MPARGTPLYVHAPFCLQKCSYCDFYSLPSEGQDVEGAIEGLLMEAERTAPWHPRTVFLGGGTPTLFSIPQLTRLLDGLQRITGFRESAVEVSAEANPESLDAEKAAALRDLGVTRLTVGVQSLREDLLRLFERPHSADQGLRAVRTALDAGFPSVGLDVIYAAPGQNLASWHEDLDRVLGLGVHHISAYCLAFEEQTPLARDLQAGVVQAPTEAEELAFFRGTRRRLAAAGLHPYEVSNFAVSGHHCRHNVNCWENGAYLGIGPSASSKVGHRRRGNHRSTRRWREALEQGRSATAWHEELAPARRLGETWWLGLRMTRGVDPAEARATAEFCGPTMGTGTGGTGTGGTGTGGAGRGADGEEPTRRDPVEDPALELAQRLAHQGLLEQRDGRWCLSDRGLPLGDAVAAQFLVAPETTGDPHPDQARGAKDSAPPGGCG